MREINFSELDTYDEEGNLLSFEDTLTEKDNIFYDGGLSTPHTDGQKVLLRLALKKLTPRQNQVVLCLDYHGMSQEEAAEILQIERSVVSRHYKSAMKKLKKFCLDK